MKREEDPATSFQDPDTKTKERYNVFEGTGHGSWKFFSGLDKLKQVAEIDMRKETETGHLCNKQTS